MGKIVTDRELNEDVVLKMKEHEIISQKRLKTSTKVMQTPEKSSKEKLKQS